VLIFLHDCQSVHEQLTLLIERPCLIAGMNNQKHFNQMM